jgi:hypothetical protein
MDFYRTKVKLHTSTWDEKKLLILELTPALEDAKGQPKAGDVRYDKDKKCTISFSPEEAYKAAFILGKLADGQNYEYRKMADTTKVEGATGGEVKSLSFVKSTKGGAMISLKSGDKTASIVLGEDEAYALKMYFEVKASAYL